MRTTIEVEIGSIVADGQYYTFDYKVWVDGKLKEEGEINDDYQNGNTPKQQIEDLAKGEALNLAIMRVFA